MKAINALSSGNVPLGYLDSGFQADRDTHKFTSCFVFTLGGDTISCRSVNPSCTADSTMEAKYIANSKIAKETFWLENFLIGLGVVPLVVPPY